MPLKRCPRSSSASAHASDPSASSPSAASCSAQWRVHQQRDKPGNAGQTSNIRSGEKRVTWTDELSSSSSSSPPLLLAVAARAVRRGPRAGVIHLAHHVGPRAPRKALLDVEKAHATAPRAAAAAALTALTALLATPAAPRAPDAPRLRQHARPHLRPPPRRPR